MAAIGLIFLSTQAPAADGVAPETAGSDAPPASHAELLARLAGTSGFSARFEETKTIGLLAMPLVSRGELYFEAPRRLLRHTLEPNESRVLVDGDRVIMAEAGHVQEIALDATSPVRPLVESLLWILSGRQDELEAVYASRYAIADDGRSWSLHLTPLGTPLDQLVSEIVVRGVGGSPSSFEVVEAGGDRSLTRLADPDTNRRFTPEERAHLFDLGAK